MYLPGTLSRDVSIYLGNSGGSHDRLIDKLENNPTLLLKYLEQGSFSRRWFSNHFPLITRLITVISKLVVCQLISWDSIKKVMNVMVSNNREFHKNLFYYKTGETHLYFSLAYAANCPVARSSWQKVWTKPTDGFPFLTDNNPFYSLSVTKDLTFFYQCDFDELLSALNTCIYNNYSEGIEILEKIVISRMEELRCAFNVLQFAIFKKRGYLEESALAFINNYCFYVFGFNHEIIYSAVNVYQKAASEYPLKFTTDSYLEYHENKASLLVNVFSLQFITTDEGFSVLTGSIFTHPRAKIIKTRFSFEGGILRVSKKTHLSQGEVLGITAAYRFKGIEFEGYGELSFEFLEKLSQLLPELSYLSFLDKDDIKNETLSVLPMLFLNLRNLSIANNTVQLKAVNSILECTHISMLELFNCTLFMPDNFPPLEHIKILNVTGSTFKKGSLEKLLMNAKELTILHAAYVGEFDLSFCIQPERICELGVDASQISIKDGKITGLEKFKSLNKIYLSGLISKGLKGVLAEIIRENKISIEFVGSD